MCSGCCASLHNDLPRNSLRSSSEATAHFVSLFRSARSRAPRGRQVDDGPVDGAALAMFLCAARTCDQLGNGGHTGVLPLSQLPSAETTQDAAPVGRPHPSQHMAPFGVGGGQGVVPCVR